MPTLIRLTTLVKPYLAKTIGALILLTTLVALDLAIPRLIERLIDQGINKGNQEVVLITGLFMLGISLFSMAIAVGNNMLSVQVGEAVARDLRDMLFVKIQNFSFANLDNHKTGQLMVRLSSDTSAVQRLVQLSLRIGTRAPLLMTGSLLLMVHTSLHLALIILPLLLVTMAIITVFVAKMEPLFLTVQQKMDRLNTILQENVSGARLIKAFVRAISESARFDKANEAFTKDSTTVSQIQAIMSPMLTFCVNIGMVIVIWVGGMDTIRGNLTEGQIIAFINYLLTTMTPLIMMSRLANVWAGGLASAQRIYEVLDTDSAITDGTIPLTSQQTGATIVFDQVSFHYTGTGRLPALSDICLTINPGETIAFLGATGSGKSTLVNLIPRFYEVTSGSITLGGRDIRGFSQDSILRMISVVPQDTILFSGSIRDNIRYGVPDASEEAVISAARIAMAHEFIVDLPNGYDTHIEERGINLSGGQKQRLAIARALLCDSKILILDDATSAVDAETESRIQQELMRTQKGKTIIMVAQRISTVLKADRIMVLDRGTLVAAGTHQELLQTSSIYQEIYDSQLGCGAAVPSALQARRGEKPA